VVRTALTAAGARVAVFDVAIPPADGDGALSLAVDVTDEAAVSAGLDAVELRWGVPDLLINNAAITASQHPGWFGRSVLDLPVDQWRRVLDVNLTGAFVCAQQAARRLVGAGRGGLIVNIGSVQGVRPTRGSADYATSKAGLVMLTHCLAGELAAHGIRVNAVAPGPIAPAGTEPGPSGTLTGAWGTPDDVAAAVVFLASPGGRYVNGHVLTVDDGASVLLREPPTRSLSPS
jgi:NAD(P)-dependent dehydrogenase (short-subunit alcohol dehydrogenase family)